MKKLLMVLATIAVADLTHAAFVQHTWNWPAASATFAGAADWSEPGNWTGGVPQAKDDQALFTSSSAAATWVKIPAAGTGAISSLNSVGGTGKSYFFGGPITFVNPSGSDHSSVAAENSTIFSDVTGSGNIYWDYPVTMYGRMDSSFVIGSYGTKTFTWNLTRYSEAAATGLREYHFTKSCRPTYGHLEIVFPKGTDAAEGVWKTTAGSPYATYVSGAVGTAIMAGAPVTGEQFPSGTFVKRIFDDSNIELSEVALDDSDAATLRFAGGTSQFYMYMNTDMAFYKGGDQESKLTLSTLDYATGNDNRLYLKLTPQNSTATGKVTIDGRYDKVGSRDKLPRVMLEYGSDWHKYNCGLRVANALIEMQPTNETQNAYYGGRLEISGNHGWPNPASIAYFDVPTGRSAVVDKVTSVVSSWPGTYNDPDVRKIGGGDLELKMGTKDVKGAFYVDDGTLGMDFLLDATTVKSMTVTANKVLRVNTGANAVTMTTLTLNNAVTLESDVNDEGVVSCVTATTADFSKGGTIVIGGNLKKLKGGDYPLWKQSAITAATAAKWTLQFVDPDHTSAATSLQGRSKLVSADGVLSLHVGKSGLFLVVQ